MENRLKQKTISSLFWKLFERGGRAAIELVIQVLLARLLAPEQFGVLAIMLVFINLANVIVQSGLNTALVQTPSIRANDSSTVFWLSFSIALFLYVAVFIAAPYISTFYGIDYLTWPLRLLAVVLIINSFNAIQVALVQRELKFRIIFHATVMSMILSGVIGIFVAIQGLGVWALVIQQLAYQVINCIVLAYQVRWAPKLVFETNRACELFSFGWKLLVSGLLDQGYQSLSDLIVGKQFSTASLGLVSQGKRYPQAMGALLDGAIQPVMLSAVARVQDDIDYVKRLVRRALKTSTFLIMPCMVLFMVVAEPVVRLLLGEQWLRAVPFLQMYCIVYALYPIHTSNLQALNGMGRSDLFLKIEIIKKIYGVVFILIAAFVFQNIYILVASYILSGIISTFVNAWPNRKVIGYSYFEQIKDICPALILSIFAAAVAYPISFLGLYNVFQILLQALIMAVVYLGFAKVFKLEAFSYLIVTIKELLGK